MIHCFEALQSDRKSFDLDQDLGARSWDVFIPTGDENNSAQAGMHKPEGGKSPPPPANLTLYIYILYIYICIYITLHKYWDSNDKIALLAV